MTYIQIRHNFLYRDYRARGTEISSLSTRQFHEIADDVYHRAAELKKTSNTSVVQDS
jgi:hypothetical protein